MGSRDAMQIIYRVTTMLSVNVMVGEALCHLTIASIQPGLIIATKIGKFLVYCEAAFELPCFFRAGILS